MIEWVIAAGAAALLLRNQGSAAPRYTPAQRAPFPGGDPGIIAPGQTPGAIATPTRPAMRDTYPGAGTVTLGGKPAPDGWNPHPGIADNVAKYAGMGAGLAGAAGIGSAGGIIGGSTFGAAGTLVGAAVPIIGIGAMVVMTVLGILKAHHAAALAREGKLLNETDPGMLNAFVMVAQAAVAGEINTVAEAKAHTDQITADWYSQVKPIQRGTWHYGAPDWQGNQTYKNSWKKGAPGVQHTQDALKSNWPPDPCNGACVIGHYFAERNAFVVLDTVQKILAGQHGVMVLPEIPAHDTQQGFPEVRMIF